MFLFIYIFHLQIVGRILSPAAGPVAAAAAEKNLRQRARQPPNQTMPGAAPSAVSAPALSAPLSTPLHHPIFWLVSTVSLNKYCGAVSYAALDSSFLCKWTSMRLWAPIKCGSVHSMQKFDIQTEVLKKCL
jgi:hypothetical protein